MIKNKDFKKLCKKPVIPEIVYLFIMGLIISIILTLGYILKASWFFFFAIGFLLCPLIKLVDIIFEDKIYMTNW